MLKRYQASTGPLMRLLDAAVISASWLAAYFLRFYLPVVEVRKGFPSFKTYLELTPLIVALWAVLFSFFEVYTSSKLLRRTAEAQLVLKSHGMTLLVFIALTYFLSDYRYSRGVLISFGILSGLALIFVRILFRSTLRRARKGGFRNRRVLLVGEGKSLVGVLERMRRFPELGLRSVGAVSTTEFLKDGSQLIRARKATQVILSPSREKFGHLDSLLSTLEDEMVDIEVVPDLTEYIRTGCTVEDFDGIPVLHMNGSPLQGFWSFAKRGTDTVLSGFGLLVLSPVLGIVALAVKATSKGSVFYGQERMGLDGRVFKMWKFRSMKVDAESKTGAVWAVANDERRTPIGAFLRKTSLDELPQLWNVFIGQMALVGPRPERPIFVQKFKGEIPHYMLRHRVKAGITGWAQINGWRGNTSLQGRIDCDLYYIRHWSYTLDLKILLMTVWRGFIHKNAY